MDFNFSSNEKNIVVALSGGGDSMALAHMMCDWAASHDKQIHLLTVNHNLRDDSGQEAEQVAQWVKDWSNATHYILTWNFDDKPNTAVMEKARQARYKLMGDYCRANDIQTLCVAHHADDQLETFLFRLAKGSGLDGLTGMREWSDFEDIKIYRPLLDYSHDDLINYCKNNQLKWIEDPSNEDDNYARPRLRKALMGEGFDAKRFAKTCERLQRGQKALVWLTEEAVSKCCHPRLVRGSGENSPRVVSGCPHEAGMTISWGQLNTYPLDIQIRVLQKCLMQVGDVDHNYPPKLERIEEIIDTIKPNKSATLFGCVLSLSKDGKSLEVRASKP